MLFVKTIVWIHKTKDFDLKEKRRKTNEKKRDTEFN